MHFALYQIVIILIALAMIGQGLQNYLKQSAGQTFLKLLVRVVVWGGMSLVVLFPHISNTVAKLIGIEGNIHAVILAGFLLVFLMIFKLLSAIEKLEQQITILTRNDSLKDLSGE